jgi:cellulose synthase/poly-beta-1,6-N-acetylglucosamine synthase-like glycosyltransferase
MRCCQNKTSFSWSYRDSSKRSLEVISRRGKRKIHTLEMSGHVQMAKSDPEAQRKSSLSDCTWLENENGFFKLEALNFREPWSSLYAYSYFFFLLIFLLLFFLSFFLFLIHSFFLVIHSVTRLSPWSFDFF